MNRPVKSEQFLLNLLGQKVSIFPIVEVEIIEVGDLVVVNTRTLQASRAKKEGGYYAIGRVCYFDGEDSVTLDNINTTKAGEVLNTNENGSVLVRISIGEGSELEW